MDPTQLIKRIGRENRLSSKEENRRHKISHGIRHPSRSVFIEVLSAYHGRKKSLRRGEKTEKKGRAPSR